MECKFVFIVTTNMRILLAAKHMKMRLGGFFLWKRTSDGPGLELKNGSRQTIYEVNRCEKCEIPTIKGKVRLS